jgi:hypothetical protein
MTSPRRLRSIPGGTDKTPFVLVERLGNGKTVDLWLGSRRVARWSTRRARHIYGRFTVLRAHKGGRSVLLRDARPWTLSWLRLICGVLITTRWGSLMVQWRGFPAAVAS